MIYRSWLVSAYLNMFIKIWILFPSLASIHFQVRLWLISFFLFRLSHEGTLHGGRLTGHGLDLTIQQFSQAQPVKPWSSISAGSYAGGGGGLKGFFNQPRWCSHMPYQHIDKTCVYIYTCEHLWLSNMWMYWSIGSPESSKNHIESPTASTSWTRDSS